MMRWTKIDLTYICFHKNLNFKSSPSIFIISIDRMLFIFWLSKIRVSPTDVISSLSPPRCCLSSGRRCRAILHSFPWSQDDLAASASSFDNASSCRLPSRAKTAALNPNHRRWPSSLDCKTPTLHWCKKVISTLVTLPTTQPHLYFTFSLARATRHQSSTYHRRSLSLSSHTHSPSAQWHLWWRASRPSFASRTTYCHVNSRKYNIFWNSVALHRVIN
jgi:hypothetical protein